MCFVWLEKRSDFVSRRARPIRGLGVCIRPSASRRLFQASMFEFSIHNFTIDKGLAWPQKTDIPDAKLQRQA